MYVGNIPLNHYLRIPIKTASVPGVMGPYIDGVMGPLLITGRGPLCLEFENIYPGGGFKYFFSPLFGEDFQFD